MSTRKVRYKKLNTKTLLPVLREDQIDPSEYESLTTENQIATGVEQAEENEYHLQAALKGVSTDSEIPVPPPTKSEQNYDKLYPKSYVEPRNYIKFSDTVEETLPSLYDMTGEDDEWLKTYNTGKKPASAQLSENDFERVMELFEDTAAEQAPFASVDNTIIPYQVMAQSMVHLLSPKLVQNHTAHVYEHWKTQRQAKGNKSLHPSVKFETHQEADDMDPYVCFRRREVRQTRKTRARDVQVADKLKKLRRELEDARQLIVFAHQREVIKRELLKADRAVFEHRNRIKETRSRLNIVVKDDDDLVNNKPQKRPRSETTQPRVPNPQLRVTVRQDNKTADPIDHLALLADKKAEKENELQGDIENKVHHHRRWNMNHVDLTSGPLPPVREEQELSFRPAKAQQLMTPPASASESMDVDESTKPEAHKDIGPSLAGLLSDDSDDEEVHSYRRRVGRLGRLFIDRRPVPDGLKSPPHEVDYSISDRFKYDHDDSDEEEQPVYSMDPFSMLQMKYRSSLGPPMPMYTRRHGGTDAAGGSGRQALPQAQGQNRPVSSSSPAAPPGSQGQAQQQAHPPTPVPAPTQQPVA